MQPQDEDDNLRKFARLLLRFSEGMAECWPEHKKIETTASQMRVILHTDIGIKRIAKQWFDFLHVPLDEASVKYAKPVNRILQQEGACACMYHAFVYGDVDTAAGGGNPLSSYINLVEILSDPSFEESREASLRYLREINKASYACFGMTPPACPTRPQIAEEIQRHRGVNQPISKDRSNMSMKGTIREVLVDLAALSEKKGGDPETIASIRDDTYGELVQEWHELMRTPGRHHASLYEACSREAYDDLSEVSPESLFAKLKLAELLTAKDAEEAKIPRMLLSQINVLTQVHGHIPGDMRIRIEETAQRLAGQIMSGDASLASIDINAIGSEILEGCTPEDLSSLADNIGSLLPGITGNLGSMQQGMCMPTPIHKS